MRTSPNFAHSPIRSGSLRVSIRESGNQDSLGVLWISNVRYGGPNRLAICPIRL